MKILIVSQYFYPEDFKVNEIAFDFKKKGYDVTVLTAKPNYPKGKFYEGYGFFSKKREIINGVEIIRTPIFPRMSGRPIPLVLNYLSFIFYSYLAVNFRVKDKFDVVFVQQLSPVTMALPGIWIKKKQKIPLVLWVLDLWPESVTANSNIKKGIIINSVEKLVKYIYNKTDVILISSSSFRQSILEKCTNKRKKIEYFPNWAEDVFTKESNDQVELPEIPKGFNIMFAGNIGESQGFESILNAAEMVKGKDINWIIVGDGRKLNWIKDQIKTRKLSKVHLLGRYPLSLMPHFFKKADVMLVSLKDTPIFGLTVPAKIQAYMASGKMILGMLNGEGRNLINESNSGFAVAAEDATSLAEMSIRMSLFTEEEKRKMSKKALDYYNNNFSKETLFQKLEIVLKDCLENKN